MSKPSGKTKVSNNKDPFEGMSLLDLRVQIRANAAVLFPHRSRDSSITQTANMLQQPRDPAGAFHVTIVQMDLKFKAQLVVFDGGLTMILADSVPANDVITAYKFLLDCLTVALQEKEGELMEKCETVVPIARGRIGGQEYSAGTKRLDEQKREFFQLGKMGRRFTTFFKR